MTVETSLSSDSEILRTVTSGALPQATVLIQLRQMKALERFADAAEALVKRESDPLRPALASIDLDFAGDDEPGTTISIDPEGEGPGGSILSVGPATDVDGAGTPRARRRRSA